MVGTGTAVFFFRSVPQPLRNIAFLRSPWRLNVPPPGRPGFKPLRGRRNAMVGTGTAVFFFRSVPQPLRNIAFLRSPWRLNVPPVLAVANGGGGEEH